jgi:protein involved in sex pheromone biosynthesis
LYNRRILVFIALLLLLSGCLPSFESEPEVELEGVGDGEQLIVSPNIKTAEDYYRTVLPFKPSEARGLVSYGLNTRLDIDELEVGMMRLAQETFNPKEYFFQEGQFFSGNTINNWLKRESSHYQGLNPPVQISNDDTWQEVMEKQIENPSYLSYILEHNYLFKKNEEEVEMGGIVLGVSLNSVFYADIFDKEGKKRFDQVTLKDDEIEKQGKIIADKVLKRVRKVTELMDVPVIIALFKEETKGSIVPGTFFAKATIDAGESSISKWEPINEKYVFLPSKAATTYDQELAEQFNQFKINVDEFFPNYVGIVGRGFYQEDILSRLIIDIPLQFFGKAEVIAFTQYVTGLVMNGIFTEGILIEINISSLHGPESLIVVKPGEKHPLVHIYR